MRKLFCIWSFFMISIILFSVIPRIQGNPIPVYPNPSVDFSESFEVDSISKISMTWIFFVFIFDFFMNVLIVYAGIIFLDTFKVFKSEQPINFSKKIFFTSVLIISVVGILSEMLFGFWIVGLFIVVLSIFFSYVLISVYLLRFSWKNGVRMALFALIINIMVWLIILSL